MYCPVLWGGKKSKCVLIMQTWGERFALLQFLSLHCFKRCLSIADLDDKKEGGEATALVIVYFVLNKCSLSLRHIQIWRKGDTHHHQQQNLPTSYNCTYYDDFVISFFSLGASLSTINVMQTHSLSHLLTLSSSCLPAHLVLSTKRIKEMQLTS